MKEHGRNARRQGAVDESQDKGLPPGLLIEPPPKETGPEPLFRVVYAIDVNAANIPAAAVCTHRIMTDPAPLAPVLHVLDHRGRVTIVDLAVGPAAAAIRHEANVSPEKARQFVEAGGTQCPQCRSSDLDCGAVQLDELCAYQEICCRNCQLKFFAVYRLAGYGLHVGDSFEVHTIPEGFGQIPDRRQKH